MHCQYNFDFTSFYASTRASLTGDNPYYPWMAEYLPVVKQILVNLNPPVSLLVFRPLAYFSYPYALAIWLAIIFCSGLLGARLVFYYSFSQEAQAKHRLLLYSVYLALFSSLMNISVAQVGTLLLLGLMLGYHFCLQKKFYWAGIIWGFVITFKLFPALLFFYALKQKHLRLFWVMLVTVIFCMSVPLLIWGPEVYYQYYQAMSHIAWYNNTWNASLLGFLVRILTKIDHSNDVTIAYLLSALMVLVLYLSGMGEEKEGKNHQAFCLSLVTMLLLSPLGWLYYFPILLFPLLLWWGECMNEPSAFSPSAKGLCFCFFFINFPIKISEASVQNLSEDWGYPFFYVLGLLMLFGFLLLHKEKLAGFQTLRDNGERSQCLLILAAILAFGLIVPGTGFFLRLVYPCN